MAWKGADSVDEGGSDWLDADTLPLNAGLDGLRPNFNPENEGPSVPEVYLTTTATVPLDVPSASPHWDTVTYTHTVGSLPLRLSPHYPPIYSLATTSIPSTTSTLGPATASGSTNGRTSNGPSSKTKTAIAIPVSIAGAAMIATVIALFLVLRQRRRQRLLCISKTTQNNGDEATPPPQRPQNSQTTLPETSNTPNMSAIQIPRKPLLPAWKNQSANNSISEETNPGYLPHESSSVLIPSGSFDFEFGDAPTSLNSKSINNALGWNASTDEFLRSEFNGSSRDDASVVSEVAARAGGGHDQGSSSHLDDVSFVSSFSGQDAGSATTTTTTTTHAVTDR